MSGTALNNRIRLALGRIAILFRNNRGKGWFGSGKKLDDGSVIIRSPRWIEFGLVNGASDTVGWTPKIITPDMVGKTVAVFTGIEGKFGNDTQSDDQKTFVANVLRDGGIAGFAHSEDEARAIVESWQPVQR
jgi:hypothetical protein